MKHQSSFKIANRDQLGPWTPPDYTHIHAHVLRLAVTYRSTRSAHCLRSSSRVSWNWGGIYQSTNIWPITEVHTNSEVLPEKNPMADAVIDKNELIWTWSGECVWQTRRQQQLRYRTIMGELIGGPTISIIIGHQPAYTYYQLSWNA